MKKIFSSMLVLLLVFLLCACEKDTVTSNNSSDLSSNETSALSAAENVSSDTVTIESSASENANTQVSLNSTVTNSKNSNKDQSNKNQTGKNKQTNSTQTININSGSAVNYKDKIICSRFILNKDYTIHTFYENSWDEKFSLCVYDDKVFYHDTITAPNGGSYFAVFTCDENGKNVKEIVRNTIFGVYTIYRGRIYYYSEKFVGGTNYETYISSVYMDGTDERQEIKLTGFKQPSGTVVKDSVMYSWIFENETPCIVKFDPVKMDFSVIKRFPNPQSQFWKNGLYYHNGELYYSNYNAICRVNTSGDDNEVMPYKQNGLDPNAFSIIDSGIVIGTYKFSDVFVELYPFSNISAPVTAPQSIYKVIKSTKKENLGDFFVCQTDDKIIYFLFNQ